VSAPTVSTDVANYDGPTNLTDRMEYAKALAQANLLPDSFRRQPANVLYAVEYGRALNISPIAALTGIHVIEGKPSASSGLISALVRRAGHRLRVRVTGTVSGGDITAVCEIVRHDDPDFTFTASWDLHRAMRSGLVQQLASDQGGRCVVIAKTPKGKPSSWEKFPEAMLKARAITEAAREACEEALSGLHYTAEELGAQVDGDEQVIVGEVIENQPPRPPAQRPNPDTQIPQTPQELAESVAKEATGCGDAVKLRATWTEAANRGLLEIPVGSVIGMAEGFAAGIDGEVTLGGWLTACGNHVKSAGISVTDAVALSEGVGDGGAEPAPEPEDDGVLPAREAMNEWVDSIVEGVTA
jgi:hypothetical protein